MFTVPNVRARLLISAPSASLPTLTDLTSFGGEVSNVGSVNDFAVGTCAFAYSAAFKSFACNSVALTATGIA